MIRKGLIESGKISENKIIYYDIIKRKGRKNKNKECKFEKSLRNFYKTFYIEYICLYVAKNNEYKEKYFSIFSEIKEKVEVAI